MMIPSRNHVIFQVIGNQLLYEYNQELYIFLRFYTYLFNYFFEKDMYQTLK